MEEQNENDPTGAGMPQFYTTTHECKANHGLLDVPEVRIPSNACYHLVHLAIVQFGPAIIHSSVDLFWQAIHHFIWEISCNESVTLNSSYVTNSFIKDAAIFCDMAPCSRHVNWHFEGTFLVWLIFEHDMKLTRTSETLVPIWTTWHYTPEDAHTHNYRCEIKI
jgi:hypothetical protein